MQISLETASSANRITSYGDDFLQVNDQRKTRSLLITAGDIWPEWGPDSFAALHQTHLQFIVDLAPEVILLGTGATQHFPASELVACIFNAGIGVEVMTTPAACRTYNILMSESRQVAAGLIIESN